MIALAIVSQDFLILTILTTLALLVIVALWSALTFPLAVLVGRMFRDRAEQDAQTAADFGEPTRADIENAYGPLVMHGPKDVVDLPRRGGAA